MTFWELVTIWYPAAVELREVDNETTITLTQVAIGRAFNGSSK